MKSKSNIIITSSSDSVTIDFPSIGASINAHKIDTIVSIEARIDVDCTMNYTHTDYFLVVCKCNVNNDPKIIADIIKEYAFKILKIHECEDYKCMENFTSLFMSEYNRELFVFE